MLSFYLSTSLSSMHIHFVKKLWWTSERTRKRPNWDKELCCKIVAGTTSLSQILFHFGLHTSENWNKKYNNNNSSGSSINGDWLFYMSLSDVPFGYIYLAILRFGAGKIATFNISMYFFYLLAHFTENNSHSYFY